MVRRRMKRSGPPTPESSSDSDLELEEITQRKKRKPNWDTEEVVALFKQAAQFKETLQSLHPKAELGKIALAKCRAAIKKVKGRMYNDAEIKRKLADFSFNTLQQNREAMGFYGTTGAISTKDKRYIPTLATIYALSYRGIPNTQVAGLRQYDSIRYGPLPFYHVPEVTAGPRGTSATACTTATAYAQDSKRSSGAIRKSSTKTKRAHSASGGLHAQAGSSKTNNTHDERSPPGTGTKVVSRKRPSTSTVTKSQLLPAMHSSCADAYVESDTGSETEHYNMSQETIIMDLDSVDEEIVLDAPPLDSSPQVVHKDVHDEHHDELSIKPSEGTETNDKRKSHQQGGITSTSDSVPMHSSTSTGFKASHTNPALSAFTEQIATTHASNLLIVDKLSKCAESTSGYIASNDQVIQSSRQAHQDQNDNVKDIQRWMKTQSDQTELMVTELIKNQEKSQLENRKMYDVHSTNTKATIVQLMKMHQDFNTNVGQLLKIVIDNPSDGKRDKIMSQLKDNQDELMSVQKRLTEHISTSLETTQKNQETALVIIKAMNRKQQNNEQTLAKHLELNTEAMNTMTTLMRGIIHLYASNLPEHQKSAQGKESSVENSCTPDVQEHQVDEHNELDQQPTKNLNIPVELFPTTADSKMMVQYKNHVVLGSQTYYDNVVTTNE